MLDIIAAVLRLRPPKMLVLRANIQAPDPANAHHANPARGNHTGPKVVVFVHQSPNSRSEECKSPETIDFLTFSCWHKLMLFLVSVYCSLERRLPRGYDLNPFQFAFG